MPVYHIQSPIEVLDQMLSKYDPEVVGVGGLLDTVPTKVWECSYSTWFRVYAQVLVSSARDAGERRVLS